MTLTDQTIEALRTNHDRLAALVAGLSDEQLTGTSGASDWTVADVLSHLGSGAEISRNGFSAAVGATDETPPNQDIWDRWNALSPSDQAASFIESDEALVRLLEGLTPEQRMGTMIDLGFLPQPVPLATALGMRLNEQVLHGWDVEVAVDTAAALTDESARLLLQHQASTMSFLLGFVGKADQVPPTRLAVDDHTLVVSDDGIRLAEGATDPSASFAGPTEAFVRLLAGRLAPEHTPGGVSVTGNVTLDELRAAFPGY